MATNRDLVEAQGFHRRRLVTALVSGTRGLEPARPGRAVVAGLALGVLLAAGAAVAGVVTADGAVQTGMAPVRSGGGAGTLLEPGWTRDGVRTGS